VLRVSIQKRSRPLALAVASVLGVAPVVASSAAEMLEEIVVTATRREASVQDIPFNIAAIGGAELQERGARELSDIARSTPGLFVLDQGARASNAVVVRGLNADPVAASEALGNDAGGTVSTYLGEIPLYIDLKPMDLERVEVLLGPQGTLYGAGTMGGAVRYIPKRPELGKSSVNLRADAYGLSKSDGLGTDIGATLNLPLGETFALRINADYFDDPGFIDYDYLVQEIGVSDPDPDFDDPQDVAANLEREEDADWEETFTGRIGLRWQPNEDFDLNLTHYYQDQEIGGRTINSDAVLGSGKYVSGLRVREPNERKNNLTALEITAGLGFAELTSATGYSTYKEGGQRDQTDLLITLEYSYEAFPSFTAFTRETQDDEVFTQEFRLVSQTEGRLSWIAGAFYSKLDGYADSKEFTPGFSQFAVDEFGGIQVRPDDLEYFSVNKTELEEMALYGELSFRFTDRWQVTLGGRYYDYELKTQDAVDFPLFFTVFDGRDPDSIELDFEEGGQEDDGFLFKFNTSYDFSDEMMGYLTVSEGYRIGNSNGVAPCPPDLEPGEPANCGLPDELQFFPDQTTNYEIGLRSRWLDGRLTLNGSIYYIDWKDPQLAATTVNAQLPIRKNGKGAESQGFDFSADWLITDQLSLRANYAYVKAELTELAPDLVATIPEDGFNPPVYEDGQPGDRLPGSPEQQGSVFLTYTIPVGENEFRFNYGISAISDVLTRTGGRGDGESLGGFAIHQASVEWRRGPWLAMLYADNLLDKYAETGARNTPAYIRTSEDIDGEPVTVRRYYKDVLRPRKVGLRLSYDFEL
jgi:outer membrane receptor protein involved in Fe transport